MDYEDTTVENMDAETAADDAQFEELVEEEEDSSLSLDEVTADDAEGENADEPSQETQGTSERCYQCCSNTLMIRR